MSIRTPSPLNAAEAGVGIFHSRSHSLIDECAICCDDEVVGHGIHPRASRSAAMFALAGQIPAPVLADLVGISTGKAAAWAKLAARD